MEMSKRYPIIDVRGRGLMVAVEFGEQRGVDGSYTAKPGCAAAVTKAAQRRNMILLTAGMNRLCVALLHWACPRACILALSNCLRIRSGQQLFPVSNKLCALMHH